MSPSFISSYAIFLEGEGALGAGGASRGTALNRVVPTGVGGASLETLSVLQFKELVSTAISRPVSSTTISFPSLDRIALA